MHAKEPSLRRSSVYATIEGQGITVPVNKLEVDGKKERLKFQD